MSALPVPPGQTPRRWQVEALGALRAAMPLYPACLISAATGTGKGTLIAGIAQLCHAAGLRPLILAHREELVTEIPDRIRKIVGHASTGIVMADRHEPYADIIAASVQTLQSPARRRDLGHFDVILTDEAHHATAPAYVDVRRWVESSRPDYKHIGFTATPFRAGADGTTRGLGRVFPALVYEHTIGDAIADGDLVPLESWDASTLTDLDGVDLDNDDEVARRVDNPGRNQLVFRQYMERTPGLPALVFAASIAHAEHLAEAFRAGGVTAAAVSADTPSDLRRSLIAQYRRADGSLPVLTSKDLLFEGFDAPATRGVYKARPTRSMNVLQQMVGRGLRTFGVNFSDEPPEVRRALIAASVKPRCLFVDFVDNGCEMRLATAADLTDDGDELRADPRPIDVDDLVRRRHHDDWGVGRVVAVHEDDLRRATVQWPRSAVAREGQRLTHPVAELKRVAESEQEAAPILIQPRAVGVRAYQTFLLPKDDPAEVAIGWYEYGGALSAGGDLGDGRSLTVLVQADAVWAVTTDPRQPVPERRRTVLRLGQGGSRTEGLGLGLAHLKAHGVTPLPIDRGWVGDPCTADQARALQSHGIRRDFARMAKGEASALLVAVSAARAVAEAQRDAHQARRAGEHRRRMAALKRSA